jgi:hypothetical protein
VTLESGGGREPRAALDSSRQRVEEGLGALRAALQQSPVGRLSRQTWTLPLIAAAVGFSLAVLLRRGARRARARDDFDDYDSE